MLTAAQKFAGVSEPVPAQGTLEVAVYVDWAAHLSVSTVRYRAHSGLCHLATFWPERIEACQGSSYGLTSSEMVSEFPCRSPVPANSIGRKECKAKN